MAFQMTAGFDVSSSGPFCAVWGVMCKSPFGVTEPALANQLLHRVCILPFAATGKANGLTTHRALHLYANLDMPNKRQSARRALLQCARMRRPAASNEGYGHHVGKVSREGNAHHLLVSAVAHASACAAGWPCAGSPASDVLLLCPAAQAHAVGLPCAAAQSNETQCWPGGCLLAFALLRGRRQERALGLAPWWPRAHEASLGGPSWRPEARAPDLEETPAAPAVGNLRLPGTADAPGEGASSQVGA